MVKDEVTEKALRIIESHISLGSNLTVDSVIKQNNIIDNSCLVIRGYINRLERENEELKNQNIKLLTHSN